MILAISFCALVLALIYACGEAWYERDYPRDTGHLFIWALLVFCAALAI